MISNVTKKIIIHIAAILKLIALLSGLNALKHSHDLLKAPRYYFIFSTLTIASWLAVKLDQDLFVCKHCGKKHDALTICLSLYTKRHCQYCGNELIQFIPNEREKDH